MFDLSTVTRGISCNGLSIIFKSASIICTSIESKYVVDVSLKTGKLSSDISFS